jgi:hypothetical protein
LPQTPLLIVQQDCRRVWLVNLQQDEPFQSPCPGEEFAALIAVYENGVTNDSRNAISHALIEQGCRYGVCFGFECSLWDDAIDWAFIATDPDYSPPDERFVMTSWHEGESLEATIFYLIKLTTFDDFKPRNFVVLMLGEGSEEKIITAVRSMIMD